MVELSLLHLWWALKFVAVGAVVAVAAVVVAVAAAVHVTLVEGESWLWPETSPCRGRIL